MAIQAKRPRNTRAALLQTLTLIQRSNSWCKGSFSDQKKDGQNKTRTSYCLAGALRAAVGGRTVESADNENLDNHSVVNATRLRLMKTLRGNPTKYGVSSWESDIPSISDVDDVENFNDLNNVTHKNVITLIKDTLATLK